MVKCFQSSLCTAGFICREPSTKSCRLLIRIEHQKLAEKNYSPGLHAIQSKIHYLGVLTKWTHISIWVGRRPALKRQSRAAGTTGCRALEVADQITSPQATFPYYSHDLMTTQSSLHYVRIMYDTLLLRLQMTVRDRRPGSSCHVLSPCNLPDSPV